MPPTTQALLDQPAKEPLLNSEPSIDTLLSHVHSPKRPQFSKKFIRVRSVPMHDVRSKGEKKELSPDTGLQPRETSKTLYRAIVVLAVYLSVGLIFFLSIINDLSGHKTVKIIDTLYFCVVTMTTVGYGDLVPSTALAKLLTCTFVFVGFGIVGALLSNGAHYLVEKQEKLLEKAFHKRKNPEIEKLVQRAKIKPVHCKVLVTGIALVTLLCLGMFVLIKVENKSIVDAFYAVSLTVTTLGYGDASFMTAGGRAFAIVWILASTICVGQFLWCLVEWTTEAKQHSLTNSVLTRKLTPCDLEAADVDGDGVVRAAEFVIFKLQQMGKIENDDIVQCMKEFNQLDVDQSGIVPIFSKSNEQMKPTNGQPKEMNGEGRKHANVSWTSMLLHSASC